MKKIKDLIKIAELNLKDLMEVKGGYVSPIDDCGGQLCSQTACNQRSYESCSGTDCGNITCGGQACNNYA